MSSTVTGIKGSLELIVMDAILTLDVQTLGKQDPYCKITCGTLTSKTAVKDGAGKTPKWEETFKYLLNGSQTQVKVDIYDQNVVSDTLIGTATIPLDKVPTTNQAQGFKVINPKKGDVGQLNCALIFVADPAAAAADPARYNVNAPVQQQQAPGGYAYPPQPQPVYAAPPQPHPQQGYVQQGYPAPAPQGYPPQGYAPQPYPQQGYAQPPPQQYYQQPAPVPGGYPGAMHQPQPVPVPAPSGYPGAQPRPQVYGAPQSQQFNTNVRK